MLSAFQYFNFSLGYVISYNVKLSCSTALDDGNYYCNYQSDCKIKCNLTEIELSAHDCKQGKGQQPENNCAYKSL